MEVTAFNLEDKYERDKFIKGEKKEIEILFSGNKVSYDPLQRVGVGISRLGTSRSVSIGAYSFALSRIDRRT